MYTAGEADFTDLVQASCETHKQHSAGKLQDIVAKTHRSGGVGVQELLAPEVPNRLGLATHCWQIPKAERWVVERRKEFISVRSPRGRQRPSASRTVSEVPKIRLGFIRKTWHAGGWVRAGGQWSGWSWSWGLACRVSLLRAGLWLEPVVSVPSRGCLPAGAFAPVKR